MAAAAPLTATVLIRIGHGRASEVGTFELPVHAVLTHETDGPLPGAFIEVDLVALHENLRAALHEVADAIPQPPIREA